MNNEWELEWEAQCCVSCSPLDPHINYQTDLQIKSKSKNWENMRAQPKTAVLKWVGVINHRFISWAKTLGSHPGSAISKLRDHGRSPKPVNAPATFGQEAKRSQSPSSHRCQRYSSNRAVHIRPIFYLIIFSHYITRMTLGKELNLFLNTVPERIWNYWWLRLPPPLLPTSLGISEL